VKPRVLTDEQCNELAAWYTSRKSVAEKAKELGISVSALYDGIARGQNKPTSGLRFKLNAHDVSRESNQTDSIEVASEAEH
jgi:predicted DNA-binding protein YlxM (UPF0122 family)